MESGTVIAPGTENGLQIGERRRRTAAAAGFGARRAAMITGNALAVTAGLRTQWSA